MPLRTGVVAVAEVLWAGLVVERNTELVVSPQESLCPGMTAEPDVALVVENGVPL